MSEPAPPDAALWSSLAAQASAAIERSLGPEVLANRWREGSPGALVPSLRWARAAGGALGRAGAATLRTDVQAFYPSVDAAVLDRALVASGVDAAVALQCARLVEGWSGFGVPGLPVGPDASALFANAVLAPADAALRALGVPFVRWVDDYLVTLCEGEPQRVLDAIDESLAAAGLSRNQAKTRVQAGPVTDWLTRASAVR
jgi:hypothetical protein